MSSVLTDAFSLVLFQRLVKIAENAHSLHMFEKQIQVSYVQFLYQCFYCDSLKKNKGHMKSSYNASVHQASFSDVLKYVRVGRPEIRESGVLKYVTVGCP